MVQFQSKAWRSRRQILRPKRDDSINPIIDKIRQLFQCLRSHPAMREAGCGFFAASFAVSG
jgi:hypothetical protein